MILEINIVSITHEKVGVVIQEAENPRAKATILNLQRVEKKAAIDAIHAALKARML